MNFELHARAQVDARLSADARARLLADVYLYFHFRKLKWL